MADMADDTSGMLLAQVGAVDLFSINGSEKTLLGTGDLNVLEVPLEGQVVTFFIVGDYTVPLNPTVPSLQMQDRYFVFPLPGVFYGVQIPESADPSEVEAFAKVLAERSLLRKKEAGKKEKEKPSPYPAPTRNVAPEELQLALAEPSRPASSGGDQHKAVVIGQSVSRGVEQGGRLVAGGLTAAAATVGQGMHWGSNWLISRIKPKEQPVEVSERLETNIKRAKQISGVAVTVSAALVTSVIGMTSQMANIIASEVKNTDLGKKLATKGSKDDPSSSSSSTALTTATAGESSTSIVDHPAVGAIKDVAVSTLVAVGEIQTALFRAGVTLVDNATAATADVVEHKYGESAGRVTRDTAAVLTDTAKAAGNMASIGPKSIAKTTIKKTATNLVVDDEETRAALNPELTLTGSDVVPPNNLTSDRMQVMMGKSSVTIEKIEE